MKRYINACRNPEVQVTIRPTSYITLRIEGIDIPLSSDEHARAANHHLANMFAGGDKRHVWIVERYGRWDAHCTGRGIHYLDDWQMTLRIDELLIFESEYTLIRLLDELRSICGVEVPFK